MASRPVVIVVVDDHRLPREALCPVLDSEPDLEAHGADSGPPAVRAVGECRPDVVLLDIGTPGADAATAVGATSRIDAANKAINTLVIQPPAARRGK